MASEDYGLQGQIFMLRQQVEALQQSDHTGARMLDLETDFGFPRDGSDGSQAVARLSSFLDAQRGFGRASETKALRVQIRVRPGTYSWPATGAGPALHCVEFLGTDRDTCIFRCSDPAGVVLVSGFDRLHNLTVENFQRSTYGVSSDLVYRNCSFRYNAARDWGPSSLVNVSAESAVVENCSVQSTAGYVGLWSTGGKNLRITGCSVVGNFSHCIRVELLAPGGRVEISGNYTRGGATGIFLPSNRLYPVERVLIQGNRVENFREEGISLDGMGNNPGMLSVIGDGTITAAANDAAGRLVITPSLIWRSLGGTNDPLPVDDNTPWENYRGCFQAGSGIPGAYARIYSHDAVAGTLTLDTFTPAADITIGGRFSAHAGFWGCVVRDNEIHSLEPYGTDYTYNTGISLWLDVYDTLVENNRVEGCSNGIQVASGMVFGAVEANAWGNIVRGNRFARCQQKPTTPNGMHGVVRLYQRYGGPERIQYRNRFRDNLIDGGEVWIGGQDDAAVAFDASNELINGASLHLL